MTNQVTIEYHTKEFQLIKYLKNVLDLFECSKTFEITYVPKEQNFRANLLLKLDNTKREEHNDIIINHTLFSPSIKVEETNTLKIAHSRS